MAVALAAVPPRNCLHEGGWPLYCRLLKTNQWEARKCALPPSALMSRRTMQPYPQLFVHGQSLGNRRQTRETQSTCYSALICDEEQEPGTRRPGSYRSLLEERTGHY